MPPRMAFGTMLPISAPENRMMAQTMPTMAPAQRVVAPGFVEQQAGVHRQRAAEAAEHRGQQIGEAVGAELLVEVGGLLPRHLQARHVEQQRDGHDAAKRADLGAALGDHAPIDLLCRCIAPIGHHKVSSPRLGRNHALRIAASSTKPNRLHVENEEEAEESDRQRQIVRHPSAEQRDGERRTARRSESAGHRAANRAPPSSRATA